MKVSDIKQGDFIVCERTNGDCRAERVNKINKIKNKSLNYNGNCWFDFQITEKVIEVNNSISIFRPQPNGDLKLIFRQDFKEKTNERK